VSGRGYCFSARIERLNRTETSSAKAASTDAASNLPTRGRTIVGRTDNIEIISREFSRGRLLTIAGPGGIGKTTLAIATAEALRPSFGNTVFFVDLAPVEDATLVLSAVASALGVVQRADEPMAPIVEFLHDRRSLVVLDNCEQVIEAVAELADRIVRDTVGAHVLVTSRETLRIDAERVHRLMPLDCPPVQHGMSAAEAMSYAAVQLFVDRTTAGFARFSLDDTLAPVAAEICRRLDGIPLAIELAAARVEFFGLVGLARGLNDMFAMLTQGRQEPSGSLSQRIDAIRRCSASFVQYPPCSKSDRHWGGRCASHASDMRTRRAQHQHLRNPRPSGLCAERQASPGRQCANQPAAGSGCSAVFCQGRSPEANPIRRPWM
jgi:AAA domain